MLVVLLHLQYIRHLSTDNDPLFPCQLVQLFQLLRVKVRWPLVLEPL